MKKIIKQLQYEIRNNGFLTATQIILRLSKNDYKTNKHNIELILNSIECKDIHKIKYTNSYIAKYKLKDLYYYNPLIDKHKKRKPKHAKKT